MTKKYEQVMTRKSTKEPQYSNCLDVKDEIGLQRLGLMTNQVYYDDPRRLTFILARYKFVSKMLRGYASVAELGCGDAFGSRLVLQEVGKLSAFDFDPLFVEDVNDRAVPRWPIEARVHDVLDGPLPETYDGIYSLDVMEHIEAAHEDTYLSNLKNSLKEHGTLIVGMPSLESQVHASPVSKEGHVNCKSGDDFKIALERHFHNVFVFSMNDEVIHTGFTPMAHYLLAVCCARKA